MQYLIEYLNTDGTVQSAHVVSEADLSIYPQVLVRHTSFAKL
jgi:hypothetical protein